LALLDETLRAYGGTPALFLPLRMEEGYGLSQEGVERCVEQHQLVDSLWSFTIATSRVSENSDPQPSRPRRPSRTRVSCLGATTRF